MQNLQTLQQYIDQNHKGIKKDFWESYGLKSSNKGLVKYSEIIVINGELYAKTQHKIKLKG